MQHSTLCTINAQTLNADNAYTTYSRDVFGTRTIRPMKNKTNWGLRARALLKQKGMKFSDAAAALNVTESAVGHYLSGRRDPKPAQLQALAKLLETSVSELLGDDSLFVSDETERKMIELFRSSEPKERETILRLLSALDAPPPPKE